MSVSYAEALDREIVMSRVFNAPRALVFEVWSKAEHLVKWFGPKNYTCQTHEIDVRVGGLWRFEMRGPTGILYGNRIRFLEIVPNERLVFEHGRDEDDDPTRFHVTITFDEQSDGKTVVALRQLHPSKEQRLAGIGFGAVEIGYTTLDNLDEYLRRQR